jgi:selenocysteine lyase/cysteine desulfurase
MEIRNTATRFETWEAPYALLTGLGEAIKYAAAIGIENIQQRNTALITQLKANLSGIPGVQIFDNGSKTCSILSFRKTGRSLEDIRSTLKSHDVYFSVNTLPWALLDFQKKNIEWAIRLSPHYFNTPEEMDRISEIVDSI